MTNISTATRTIPLSALKIYEEYRQYTNRIINGEITDINRIEHWMDSLIDWNFDHRFVSLYKRLCRHLFPKYPEPVSEHVLKFLKLYGDNCMETVSFSIKVDSSVYDDASAVLKFLGLTVEEAVTIFLQRVATTGKIPLDHIGEDLSADKIGK